MSEESLDDAFNRLAKFGLTSYEIKVYRTLLLNGPMTSMKVVNLSGVPQPRIYDVFNTLISKGMVVASPGKKKIYKAVPVAVALGHKIEEFTLDMDYITTTVVKHAKESDFNEPLIWIIESEKNIRQKIREVISAAKNELLVCVNSAWWEFAKKYILHAMNSGITVAIVLSPEIELEETKDFSGAFIRRRQYPSSQVIIADREHGILDTESKFNANRSSVYIEENELIHILNYYFYHTLWKPAELIGYPTKFGRLNFATNWFLCDICENYLRKGVGLKIRLKGKISGKMVELSGPVQRIEIIEGLRHSLVMSSKGTNYSVGGRSATQEDVALYKAVLEQAGRNSG